MTNRINFDSKKVNDYSVKINKKINNDYCNILISYCNDYNIKLTSEEIDSYIIILSEYGIKDVNNDYFYFWIE